ncbi:Predicted dithiol-disulfide isomerase, DsbA family [Paenibacillus sp. ov031]|nr:Predicted dithiol-disulfide isomerase, DsbA family [Paenibacillus sp. ov031]
MNMSDPNNMVCDLETGVCGVAEDEPMEVIDFNHKEKTVTMYYVTDPICSHCWALEPVLNRFVEEYDHYFKTETLMGGLLPSWHGFSDGGNGIQKPSDVAEHWKEVGEHSRMPIDGSLWYSDPILSSYPPSRVFKVIQQNHAGKEIDFLRNAREAVFAFNRNIGQDDVLIEIVNKTGLHGKDIVEKASEQSAQDLLEEDFDMVAKLGVRGFPTIILMNEENKGVKIVGARSIEIYEAALKQVLNEEPIPKKKASLSRLLKPGHILFSREIEVMYDIQQSKVTEFVQEELAEDTYQLNEMMNEVYIKRN